MQSSHNSSVGMRTWPCRQLMHGYQNLNDQRARGCRCWDGALSTHPPPPGILWYPCYFKIYSTCRMLIIIANYDSQWYTLHHTLYTQELTGKQQYIPVHIYLEEQELHVWRKTLATITVSTVCINMNVLSLRWELQHNLHIYFPIQPPNLRLFLHPATLSIYTIDFNWVPYRPHF